MAGLLYLAFLASGIAGLIYETIWSRYLGLLLGHSAYAQVIVLVVFLGGMAAGAALVGRHSERRRRPWLDYAIVEIVIGLFGLAFHSIYTAASAVAYDSIFPALAGGLPLMLAKWAIAAVLVLPQSILLGMTFPLMSAEVLRRFPAAPGRVLAMLYFTNGLGGAFGVLLSGFWLVGRAGLGGSLAVAGVMNIAIGLVVAAAAGLRRPAPVAADPGAARAVPLPLVAPGHALGPATTPGLALPRLRTVLLAVSAGTAIASFIYEIAWIRMLSLVL